MTADRARAGLRLGGAAWVVAALAGQDAGEATARFYLSEVVWLLAQCALLAGTVALWRSRPHGGARTGGAGFGVATAGWAAFVVAEVVALASGKTQDGLLPVAALITAAGMVVAGVAVLRARRWGGWHRLAPVAVGVYPFVAMFPFAASAGDGPPLATLALWGASFVALGAAAGAEASEGEGSIRPAGAGTGR
jgi:hypothetical protein